MKMPSSSTYPLSRFLCNITAYGKVIGCGIQCKAKTDRKCFLLDFGKKGEREFRDEILVIQLLCKICIIVNENPVNANTWMQTGGQNSRGSSVYSDVLLERLSTDYITEQETMTELLEKPLIINNSACQIKWKSDINPAGQISAWLCRSN